MSVYDIRKSEEGMTDKIDRGNGTVSLPELRKAEIGLVVATQLARFNQNNGNLPGRRVGTRLIRLGRCLRHNWHGIRPWKWKEKWFKLITFSSLENHLNLWIDASKPNSEKLCGLYF